jgi:hypothetical protein
MGLWPWPGRGGAFINTSIKKNFYILLTGSGFRNELEFLRREADAKALLDETS